MSQMLTDYFLNASFTPFHAMAAVLLLLLLYYCVFGSHPVYLLDFCCYRPPDHTRVTTAFFVEQGLHCTAPEAFDFHVKSGTRSGISSEAGAPHVMHHLPPDCSLEASRDEIETVLFSVVKNLLEKHNVSPGSIDIVVSNCSLFCPTPSITSMVINKFGLRSNVKSFSLCGMGCSAGILSIGVVKDILKVHKNSLALVVSMEAITSNAYFGSVKSMILTNTLFRTGGVAILLSNKRQDRKRAKYRLKHLVRTHMGEDDDSYHSVFQENDESGHMGVYLSRNLLQVAGKALRTNISDLAPRVLPFSELLLYACSLLPRRKAGPTYTPNFKKSFEHFCIHAGGRAVIDAVEESLRLSKEDAEASRMTLYRFGNTSSSSIWYELCYLEAKGRVKKGDRVWQIAFGSGFKCNSAVWKCISELDPKPYNAWSDRIDRYPVEVPRILDH
ncbi:PREDICTED: 3-ketoacyl-CoA synthase 7 [Ipomoea nil]|uniref:3-ketoacyl-CoA synthase 7 n=1 Tax=Ipomoea nil TaxID=35883 RepID=UPI0009009FF0|nr:PREDICTED: 3-ketoacyl-CoA synthase 7 [Ipomoea nil]